MKQPNEAQRARIHELAVNDRPTPDAILEEAKSPSSVLHDLFTWDDEKAAHQHRLQEARALIRTVLYVEHGTLEIATPFYVRDPMVPSNQQGYISLAELRDDVSAARASVRMEVMRVESALLRAQRIAKALDCLDLIDDLLARLQSLKLAVAEPQDNGDDTAPATDEAHA